MKQFLVIRNADIGMLASIVVQDENGGKFGIAAYNQNCDEDLRLMLSQGRFFKEERTDDRTIVKREVRRDSPEYLDVFKTKVGAPYVVHMSGQISAVTMDEALARLWKMFSPKEQRPSSEV